MVRLVTVIMGSRAIAEDVVQDAVADGSGLVVEFRPQPTRTNRGWSAVALAAVAAVAMGGAAACSSNAPNEIRVATAESAAVPTVGATADADDPAPEDSSTNAGLQWTEIHPPFESVYGLQSLGDGRVLVRVRDGSDARVLVTTNGTDWAELPIPGGIRPGHVDISGDRWLVTGSAPYEEGVPYDSNARIFYSDDEGGTWNELVVVSPSVTDEPFVVERSWVESALVSGQQIVIGVATSMELDVMTLLVDRGLAADVESIVNVMVFPDGDVTLVRRSANSAESETIEVTRKELDLTPDQFIVVEDISYGDRVRIFSSDGFDPKLVAEYEGSGFDGIATADGFLLNIGGAEGLSVISPDGDAWAEIPIDPFLLFPFAPRAVDGHGSIWGVVDGATVVRRLDLGAEIKTVSIQRGIEVFGELAVGPAGLTATALPAVNDATNASEPRGMWSWVAPDVLVGWSVDGVEWAWDTVDEAFGISEGVPSFQLAVGSDFVLAIVEVHQEPVEITEVANPVHIGGDRWFIATVPGG